MALEADYDAMLDQAEVMRETIGAATERVEAVMDELDEERRRGELNVQKVLAFMLPRVDAARAAGEEAGARKAEAALLQAEARREVEVQRTAAFWLARVAALEEEAAALRGGGGGGGKKGKKKGKGGA